MQRRLGAKETQQFIRFCIVGGICWLIDFGVLWVLTEKFNANYQVAQITSYIISLCFNYLLTVYWTFRTESSMFNLVGIVAAHLFNLTLRTGLMSLFMESSLFDSIYDHIVSLLEPMHMSCPRVYMAFVPTTIICAVTNYIVIRTVVKYSKKKG